MHLSPSWSSVILIEFFKIVILTKSFSWICFLNSKSFCCSSEPSFNFLHISSIFSCCQNKSLWLISSSISFFKLTTHYIIFRNINVANYINFTIKSSLSNDKQKVYIKKQE